MIRGLPSCPACSSDEYASARIGNLPGFQCRECGTKYARRGNGQCYIPKYTKRDKAPSGIRWDLIDPKPPPFRRVSLAEATRIDEIENTPQGDPGLIPELPTLDALTLMEQTEEARDERGKWARVDGTRDRSYKGPIPPRRIREKLKPGPKPKPKYKRCGWCIHLLRITSATSHCRRSGDRVLMTQPSCPDYQQRGDVTE